jgi:hypothetical protein
MDKKLDGDKFVKAFISMFDMYKGELFVGSRKQARIRLQLKLGRFIPKLYIDKAFKSFISSGIVEDTKERMKIAPRIGKMEFNTYHQKIYRLKIEDEKFGEKLEKIKIVFADIEDSTYALPQEEDIKIIRKLEKVKDIKLKDLNDIYLKYYEKDDDISLLYNHSREEIKDFINVLDKYDPLAEKKKHEQYSKRHDLHMDDLINRWRKFINRVFKFLDDVIDETGWISKILISYSCFEGSSSLGNIIINEYSRKDNVLVLKGDDSFIEININDIFINDSSIIFSDNVVKLTFYIDKFFAEDLIMLRLYKRKIFDDYYNEQFGLHDLPGYTNTLIKSGKIDI